MVQSKEGQEEDLHGENDNLRFNLHNANLQKELAQADRERLVSPRPLDFPIPWLADAVYSSARGA